MATLGDESKIIEIDAQQEVNVVLFTKDGKQLLSGNENGVLQWWRVADGYEVEEPIRAAKRASVYAAALSPDGRWLVCGLRVFDMNDERVRLVGVWDAQTREKIIDISDHSDTVFSVDVSPDSTTVATGAADNSAFIWSITTGKRLIGPLRHENVVVGVRFSPRGDRIATATGAPEDENSDKQDQSIRIYDSQTGQQLLDIPCQFLVWTTPLAWSTDGRQLFAASRNCEVNRFETSSGSLISTWSVPGGVFPASVILSRNDKFAIVVAHKSLSFWDTSTQQQIGSAIEHTTKVWSTALSPDDHYVATGEQNGKVILRSLHDVLPASYFTVNVTSQVPFMYISDAAFKFWIRGDLTEVERVLTEDIAHTTNTFHLVHALAQRAVIRTRLKKWDLAIEDAKKSVETQRSVIGYLAMAIAHVRKEEHETALRVFDLAFSVSLPSENNFLLLIKAIILSECGKHSDAIARATDLLDIVDDKSPYVTSMAQMLLLSGGILIKKGNHKQAIKLLKQAQGAIPIQQSPPLTLVSLVFGWDFDSLPAALRIQLDVAMNAEEGTEVSHSASTLTEPLGGDFMSKGPAGWDPDVVQTCLTTCESNGDAAMQSQDPQEAVLQYSIALSLNPSYRVSLLVKRSNARAMLGLWEDALKDADGAIKANPLNLFGYERRHAALHALQRYDEAIGVFTHMCSLIEGSSDPDVRELAKKYISPARSEMAITSIAQRKCKACPLVLIDVKSGRLCDGPERMRVFKLDVEFKRLHSSLTLSLADEDIEQVVEKYFQYVMFSHIPEEKETLYQDINMAGSIWNLGSSSSDEKLRSFCEIVRAEGYRWAWSDTCCIDRTISIVLNRSIVMTYRWYKASAATFVHLTDVDSPSALGGLTESGWLTRAWTPQEVLASNIIRFYTRDWQLYLDDTHSNHKDSPEIVQELADAMGIACEQIISFDPDILTAREKLQLAANCNVTLEEDAAYSLIGIFKSEIVPRYGEGEAALGHLLEEALARSGDVTMLAWSGKASSYHSCLPSSLAVYGSVPKILPILDEGDMDEQVATSRSLLSQTDAIQLHDRIMNLPAAYFEHRRLHLPCLVFAVKTLSVQGFQNDGETNYHARISGIGHVDFLTSDAISPTEARRLIFVHPWIGDLSHLLDNASWDTVNDSEDESDAESESSSILSLPSDMDDCTRALRLIVRLQQPFLALLLRQQPNGEFRRIATEHDIVVPGIDRSICSVKDIRTEVVEIL